MGVTATLRPVREMPLYQTAGTAITLGNDAYNGLVIAESSENSEFSESSESSEFSESSAPATALYSS